MSKFSKLVCIPAFAVLMAACYPKGPEFYSDLDLTVTDYDTDYAFGEQQKYFMADTVEYITNIEDSEIDEEDVDRLLEEIESKFASRGYQRLEVMDIDEAEFVITVSIIASRNTGVGWIPSPPWYPGWGWGPGWGGWYPPYWGGYYTYSYTTGSVITNWWDPQEEAVPNSSDEDLQPVHWVATFNGLLSGSRTNNTERIIASIDQAFKQSPYIQRTN